MREIMFRGKRSDNGEWIEGYLFGSWGDAYICLGMENRNITKEKVDGVSVGQYTGLTDKNGKKIYEGDVLSTDNGTLSNTGRGIVKEYKGMYVSFYGQDMLERDCYDELNRVCNAREVIGNIHDNPELVEEELE